jgi:adenosylmethionine-8-amino-7-oxononanoate aminotransferase
MHELRNSADGELPKIVKKTYRYWVEMNDGKKYLDIQSGNSAFTLGYGNKEVIQAMADKIDSVAFIRGNTGETDQDTQELVNFILSESRLSVMSWAIAGTSAVECAIMMNDSYWKTVDPTKNLIVSCTPSYHGTSYLTRAMANPYNIEFTLDRLRCIRAPKWNKIEQREFEEERALGELEKRFEKFSDSKNIGAFIVETCPWMNGIMPYSKRWWEGVRYLCTQYKVNLITDDVAVCWGKSLSYFGFSTAGYNIQPDITACGKSLSAGYAPIGFAAANSRIGEVLSTQEWGWGHTWQPYMAGIGAMKKVIQIIQNHGLFTKSKDTVIRLNEIAKDLENRILIKSFRQQGLFLELDFIKPMAGLMGKLTNAGLLSTTQQNNSIRIIANLIADDEYFNELRTRLDNFFSKNVSQ